MNAMQIWKEQVKISTHAKFGDLENLKQTLAPASFLKSENSIANV